MKEFLDEIGGKYIVQRVKQMINAVEANSVTKQELQAELDALDINIDLSSYATKEELTNAINSIDLSSYALKTEIPSLEGYATTEYVDNAIANIPSGGGNVDLSNYYTKAETDERDLMISPFNCLGEKYVTDNIPNIRAYAGTNTITFEAGIDVRGGILVDGEEPYYFNDYSEIDSSKNIFTFEADSEVIVKDYVFYFGESTEGLSNVTFTITNGSKSLAYSIPIYGDGTQEVYYRKIKYAPLYIERTKIDFAKKTLLPINDQVYKNRDEITRLKESGISGKPGKDGKDGITPHIDSTTKHWMIGNTDTGVIAEGTDGVSPTVTVTKEGKVATITCTDVNGTTTATISDGANGSSSGGSSSGSEEVYSKEEIAIGTWIDGSTIYRKVFEMTIRSDIANGSPVVTSIEHGIENFNDLVDLRCINKSSSMKTSIGAYGLFPVNLYTSLNNLSAIKNYSIRPTVTKTKIMIDAGIQWKGEIITVIVEYTKTV